MVGFPRVPTKICRNRGERERKGYITPPQDSLQGRCRASGHHRVPVDAPDQHRTSTGRPQITVQVSLTPTGVGSKDEAGDGRVRSFDAETGVLQGLKETVGLP